MLGVIRIPQPSGTSVRCQQRAAESQGCRVQGRLAIQLWHNKEGNLEEGGRQASLRLPLLKHFLLFRRSELQIHFTDGGNYYCNHIIPVTICWTQPNGTLSTPSHGHPPQWKENPFGCQTDLASTLALPLTSNVRVKSLQSCCTLCDPMDYRLLCPWGSPGKNTRVGCHALLQGI